MVQIVLLVLLAPAVALRFGTRFQTPLDSDQYEQKDLNEIPGIEAAAISGRGALGSKIDLDAIAMRGAWLDSQNGTAVNFRPQKHRNHQDQERHDTSMDRYPLIFHKLQQTLGPQYDQNILSFGCSTGEEVRSLRRYFPNSMIHGIDVDTNIIHNNMMQNNDTGIQYFSDVEQLRPKSYGAILAMSCLCHFPAPPITFRAFNYTVGLMDEYLQQGGYLVIYNANYYFTDTPTANSYVNLGAHDQSWRFDSGWVERYDMNGILARDVDPAKVWFPGQPERGKQHLETSAHPYVFFKKL